MESKHTPENKVSDFDYDENEDEYGMYQACPNCGRGYDEIDFEYQMCHHCKHDASEGGNS